MRSASRLGRAAAVALALVVAVTVEAADEPDNIIKYRRNVMKSVGANIANIAMVAKGEVTFVANVALNARAIRDGLNLAGGLFPDGTDIGETNALPKLWQDRAGFDDALRQARAAADDMVAAAETGDLGEIQKALGALGKRCGECHKPYRKEL
jgi:cytochrome c556